MKKIFMSDSDIMQLDTAKFKNVYIYFLLSLSIKLLLKRYLAFVIIKVGFIKSFLLKVRGGEKKSANE